MGRRPAQDPSSGRGAGNCRGRLQRVVAHPAEAAFAPARAPGVGNPKGPLLAGVNRAVGVDVGPDVIVVADHGHGVIAVGAVDPEAGGLTGEGIDEWAKWVMDNLNKLRARQPAE